MILFKDIHLRQEDGRKAAVKIVYQDESLLVVWKPSGLRVIQDRWNPSLPNLHGLLSYQHSEVESKENTGIYIVHRIDADTSGLVLFARNGLVHRQLNKAFEENRVNKTYLAIVNGRPEKPAGIVDFPLRTDRKGFVRIDVEGKPSITEYKLIETFRRFSLLEVFPRTGRTHQIRVHLQTIGCPLVVDPLYSGRKAIAIDDLKKIVGEGMYSTTLISRLTLHAWKLKIEHPVHRKMMDWTGEIPKDFRALLNALRKWDRLN